MEERERELDELQRHWTPPAELARGGPRDVKLSGSGVAVTVVACLLLLGAIAAAIGLSRKSARDAANRQELEASGIETQAVVTRHWRTGGKEDQRRLTYEFAYDGRSYRASVNAPRKFWDVLPVGSPVRVRFVPARPELSHPIDWRLDVMPSWVPAIVAVGLVFPGLLLLFMIRRQMQLLSDGRAAPGIVTGHRRVKGGQVLKYEFPLLSGGIGKGRGGQSRRPPAVGSTIAVVYDRDNPKRNAPYPFDMVRIVR
jgi:hypothetical protein